MPSSDSSTKVTWLHRAGVVGLLIVLLALAFGARVVPAHSTVFPQSGEVRLLGVDSYYHLRHTQFAVDHFPALQRWDVGTNYPIGQRGKAVGLHDLAMAAAAMVVGLGDPSEATTWRTVAWTPPILGILALAALFVLVRRAADSGAGLIACVLVCIYPGGFLARTTLGYSDHHAAEILWFILSALGVLGCFVMGRSGGWRAWGRALAQALPMAIFLFTWMGAPLHMVILGLGVLGVLLMGVARERPIAELATAFLRYGICLFGLVAAASLFHPDLIMMPEMLGPILGACGMWALGPAVLLTVARWLQTRNIRRFSPVAIALSLMALIFVAIGLAVVLIPNGQALLDTLFGPKHSLVAEHVPVDSVLYWQTLGVPGLIALVSPLVCGVAAYRDARYQPALFLSLVGLVLTMVWWRSHDYHYVVPVVSGMSAATAFWVVLQTRLGRGFRRRLSLVSLLLAVTVLPIWPLGAHPPPWPLPAQIAHVTVFNDGWAQAMNWMSTSTPRPTLPIDSQVDPWHGDFRYPVGSYGVITPWDAGSVVAAVGQRAPVASQGVSTSVASWMLLEDEDAAIDFWEGRLDAGERIRYVVLDAATLGDHFASTIMAAGQSPHDYIDGERSLPGYGPRYEQAMAARLYLGAGRGLRHHRLVFQSVHRSALYYQTTTRLAGRRFRLTSTPLDSTEDLQWFESLRPEQVVQVGDGRIYGACVVPTVRVFEIVTGSTVLGTVSPNDLIEARLHLSLAENGQELTYRQTVQADDQGRFTLVLPYATDGLAPADVQPVGLYGIFVARGGEDEWQRVVQIGVPERYVQSGEVLDLGMVQSEQH